MTATQALCNIFKFKSAYNEIYEDNEKAIRLLLFAAKMLNSPKDKAISSTATLAMNVMVKFDQFFIPELEDNKEIEFEEKQKLLTLQIESFDEGIRPYCEAATKTYASLDNSDAIYRLLMSECRLLHQNFKLIELFAGDEDFMKTRLRLTQKYPSGMLNDSIVDLQKIMGSYAK